jgi:GTP 3',8-cyclase
MAVTDEYGRTFQTLRVSLLSRCNLSCQYCTIEDALPEEETSNELGSGELLQVITRLQQQLQFQTIRLTGGEPLLYPDLIPVIKGIKQIGIPKIKLTTNGFLLDRMASSLKASGVHSLNVSLDAIDEDIFFLVSKRENVQRILKGIDAALQCGLKIKINAVIMKGINESQILPLVQYAFERKIVIRLLEVMSMGHLYKDPGKYLFSQKDLLDVICSRYKVERLSRRSSSTANYWRTDDGNTFGIIANETEPFCADCNRLRLDSRGNMYGCLSSNEPISLVGLSNKEELDEKLNQAILQKQPVKFKGSNLSMLHIGG